MNYEKIYEALVRHRQTNPVIESSDVYVEIHHILPRCLGGTDDPSNLVVLTGREHYVAHKILLKIYENRFGTSSKEFFKVANAVLMMAQDRRGRKVSSRDYEKCRRVKSDQMKQQVPWNKGKKGIYSEATIQKMKDNHADVRGERNPMFGLVGEAHPKTGKKMSKEAREKIGNANRGKKVSIETRRKISESRIGERNPMYGRTWTKRKTPEQIAAWKARLSATHKSRASMYVNGMKGKHLRDFMTEDQWNVWLSHHHHLSGSDNPAFGKVWIFNPNTKERRFVSSE